MASELVYDQQRLVAYRQMYQAILKIDKQLDLWGYARTISPRNALQQAMTEISRRAWNMVGTVASQYVEKEG